MKVADLRQDQLKILIAILSRRAGTPSELPDRVDEFSVSLGDRLRSLDYDDLDHLFMEVMENIA